MNKHLCGIGIMVYFFLGILEFDFRVRLGQYHSNYSSQNFQDGFSAQENNY